MSQCLLCRGTLSLPLFRLTARRVQSAAHADRNGTVRRAGANPRHSRESNVKRNANLWRNLKSVTKAQRLLWASCTSATSLHCYMAAGTCFFFCAQCGAVNAGESLRLLKSLCDGSGESSQKARRKVERGLMPNEHVVADAKRTF